MVTTKVSVVVPVYNPGPFVEPCIESLLAQTMPPGELELVFVDDGSTDQTLARLREVEAAWPHVRVISIPNSGWPGKPRNVGTDAARGAYVMYVDQDDRLEPEAMQRMYDLGAANDADLVLGKVVSDFRGVHHALYRHNVASCTVWNSRLINSQTPHKMLRTQFLRDHGIRYAEGRRRLEDQLFITRAYFAARSASIVGDYICYRYQRRPDGGNAGSTRVEPADYYTNLGEVLDVVDAHTAPGPDRDRFYRRFLHTEMLGRLGGRKLLTSPREHNEKVLAEVGAMMRERFGESVDLLLGSLVRVRAAMARAGRLEDLLALARRVRRLRLEPRLTGMETELVDGAPAVVLLVEVGLLDGDAPLRLEPADGWLLPRRLVGDWVPDPSRRVGSEELSGDLVVRHRDWWDEWFISGSLEARVERVGEHGEVRWSGRLVLDPGRCAGGRPLRGGHHDILVRTELFGLTRNTRLTADLGELALVGDTQVRLSAGRRGHLGLDVGGRPTAVDRVLQHAIPHVGDPGHVGLDLRVLWTEPPTVSVALTATPGGRTRRLALTQEAPGSTRWVGGPVDPGTYTARLTVRLPGRKARTVELDRPVVVAPVTGGSLPDRIRRLGRRLGGRAVQQLPRPWQRRLRQSRQVAGRLLRRR